MNFQENTDGTATYTTVQGDMVDQIAFHRYGVHENTTVLVYKRNPGLVDHGLVLPAGIEVILPVYVKPETKSQISLWT